MAKHTLHGLDHLRAFAISFVLLFHYRIFGHPAWTELPGKFGWTGVDLFFVLSGFLISSQLFAQIKNEGSFSLRVFVIKRFFRIVPAYLAVLGLYVFLPVVREREALPALWKMLTFTQNYGLNIHTSGTFSHAWSLCIEEQFYLLLPLLLLGLLYWKGFSKGKYILAFLFAFGIFIRIWSWNHFIQPNIGSDDLYIFWYKHIYYVLYTRLDGLLVGVFIAALLAYRPQFVSRISGFGNAFLVAGLLVLAAAYWICIEERSWPATVFGFPVIALGYGLMVLGAVMPSSVLYRWQSRFTAKLAAISYVLYLSHKIAIHLTQLVAGKAGMDIKSNAVIPLSIAGTLIVALLLQQVVERPFLRLRGRLLKG